jgi:chromosome condensin MukBEF MukE localization factor
LRRALHGTFALAQGLLNSLLRTENSLLIAGREFASNSLNGLHFLSGFRSDLLRKGLERELARNFAAILED